MFDKEIYKQRRARLMREVAHGMVVLPANRELPFNYGSNTLPFRQDSTFLYYVGLDVPGLVAVLDCDSGQEYLYGDNPSMDDIIWTGPMPSVEDMARSAGIQHPLLVKNIKNITDGNRGRDFHYLKPYQAGVAVFMADLLGISLDAVMAGQSDKMARAVIAMRRTKHDIEIAEIEKAVDATRLMHKAAMCKVAGGDYMTERDVYAAISGVALSQGYYHSFPPIVTVHGEVFHNHGYHEPLRQGQLLLVDAGAESLEHYAGDMTRTIPVGGKFSHRQKDIYDIVCKANECVALSARPGTSWADMHDRAARVIASGLKDIGLMRGDTDDIVATGAYALFFPHGLGHLMGLDVHDMENIGEDLVGYSDTVRRSSMFGKNCLRFGLPLEPGMVITDEPGIYFIPQLIDQWRAEGKFADFIDYGRVDKYRNFGGIRIEDDILVTEKGCRIMGTVPLPKTSDDVERFFCN